MRSIVAVLTFVCLLALAAAPALAADRENYFSKTELQLHADFDREPLDGDIFTATFEHFSEWKYGDNFFFLDIEGESNFKTNAETLYFEYAPRLSFDKVLDKKIHSADWLGETYLTLQYNDSDRVFINRVWLAGVSVDFAFQPNFGWSSLFLMARDEDTQDASYQITYCWGQPFSVADYDLEFKGFADFWKNDETHVFLTEPQLRLKLSSFVGDNHLLSSSVIGTEIEISNDFFGEDHGWEVNPTLFFAFPF